MSKGVGYYIYLLFINSFLSILQCVFGTREKLHVHLTQ